MLSGVRGGALARGIGPTVRDDWQVERSSELFELKYGKALVESMRAPGEVPVFGTNGQTGTHSLALFKGPGVIIGRKGAGHLGVHWSDRDYWVIDTAYSLVPSKRMDLKYSYYLIKYVGLNHLKHGTSNPSLTRDAFGAQYFPVPSLPEQRAIAETLGAVDDKIESNRRAIASISALMDAQSEKHGAGLAFVPLGSIAREAKVTFNPSKYGDTAIDHYSLPAFDAGARPEHVAASAIMSNKLKVSERSILLSRLNPRFNRTWWVAPARDRVALASTEFLVLTAGSGMQLAAVWLAVRDASFRAELPKRVTGTSGSHQRVRPGDVLSIEVPDFSSASDQMKELAFALLERAESLRAESDRLVALRDALLPELLSGRIRVPVKETAA